MKTFAIIPSGGLGRRMNNPPYLAEKQTPKQYLKFQGKELIAYTLQIFQDSPHVEEIIIPAQKEFFPLLNEIKEKYSLGKIKSIVEGGSERQHSVFNALKSIGAEDEDLIIVHDAVRPLLPHDILYNAISAAKDYGAAVVALKAKDTLIKGTDSVHSYVDRNEIYYAQTPQIFRYKILFGAMKKAEDENFTGTDESMIVHRSGYKVKIVEGSSLNFKITNPDDIRLFQFISEKN